MSQQIDDPKAFLDELSRREFSVFVRRVWPLISGGEPLLWNWHLDAICYQLERVRTGECRRLIISLPPRSAKSKIVSCCWLAWMLGRSPARNFVGVSYNNELSGKFARDCLAVMETALYRELFPRTRISPRRSATYDFETTAGGGRLATSVSGTLTGRGGDIVVLDDVIKPEDAASETVRARVNEWFRSTLPSRLDNKVSGAFLLVMQRLHEDDPVGVLLEQGGWDYLCLPAIATEDEDIQLGGGRVHHRKLGDVLHPEREPAATLKHLEREMGSTAFSAQYQQAPRPAAGNMVRAAWLCTYVELPEARGGIIVQSWDTASKENPHNSFSACVTALLKDKKLYLIDVYRRRLEFPKLRYQVTRLAREHKADTLLIEDQSSGTHLLQFLRAEAPRGVPAPIARRPDMDKVARVSAISAMIEAGQLLLPPEASWLAEFKAELLGFPNAKFDDQVDGLSQLMIWMRDKDRWSSSEMVHGPYYGDPRLRR